MLFVPVIMAGCSAYRGESFLEESKTKIDLEAKNFKVRKLGAQGNGVSTYLFGFPIGGGGSGVVGIPLSDQNVAASARLPSLLGRFPSPAARLRGGRTSPLS